MDTSGPLIMTRLEPVRPIIISLAEREVLNQLNLNHEQEQADD